MRARYLEVPLGAQAVLTARGNAQPFTDWGQVTARKAMGAFATLEPRGWPLDGSRALLEDSPSLGYWSTPNAPARMELTLPQPCSATGITVQFSPATGEWCSLRLLWYAGSVLLAGQTVEPTGPVWVVDRAVENFDRLVIEPLVPNLAGHFAKIQYVALGKDLCFDVSELRKVRLFSRVDPQLLTLEPDTLEVAVECGQNLHLLPQQNQKMELYRGDKLQAVQYIQRCIRQGPGSYTFFCTSAVGLLEGDFLGGMYENTPASSVLAQVLEGMPFALHDSLKGECLTGYLPVCSRQKALQQIAFALGAVVSTQGDGIIRLLPLTRQVGQPFLSGDILQGGRLEVHTQVTQVEVAAHRYAPDTQERFLLKEVPVHGENVLLTFSGPHHSYAITGGRLTASGTNWVRITADGPVTLTAKGYIHNAVRHVRAGNSGVRGAVCTVDSATLVHSGNVGQVLNRLYSVAVLHQSLHQQAAVTTQKAGQTVICQSPWDALFQGCITAMDLTLTPGGQVAKISVLGRYLSNDRYGYSGEFYAGEKEVNPCI